MKKYLAIIAIVLAAVGCRNYGPEGAAPKNPVTSEGIDVTVTVKTDSIITVTLAPKGKASYYSYLVDASPVAEELNAESLYKVLYKSVAQGTFSYAKQQTATFDVEGLDPNTVYQIYAVAGSETGIPSAVTVKAICTSDNVAPSIEGAESDEQVIVVSYNEDILLSEDPKVTAYVFAVNTEEYEAGEPIDSFVVPTDSLCVDGADFIVTVPDLPAGAKYVISYPEGTVTDLVGQAGEGVEYVTYKKSDFWGKVSTTTFALTLPEDEVVAKYGPFEIEMENEYDIAVVSDEAEFTMSYTDGTKKITQSLVFEEDFDDTMFFFPEAVAGGSTVVFTAEEGLFEDIYGNTSEAAEWEVMYSFGYKLEDILGWYDVEATCYYDGPETFSLHIEENDKADDEDYADYNVKVSGFGGEEEAAYGIFDLDGGTLTIKNDAWIVGGPYNFGDFMGLMVLSGNGEGDIVFSIPEPHTIGGANMFFGLGLYTTDFDWVGFYDVWTTFSATEGEAPAEDESPEDGEGEDEGEGAGEGGEETSSVKVFNFHQDSAKRTFKGIR